LKLAAILPGVLLCTVSVSMARPLPFAEVSFETPPEATVSDFAADSTSYAFEFSTPSDDLAGSQFVPILELVHANDPELSGADGEATVIELLNAGADGQARSDDIRLSCSPGRPEPTFRQVLEGAIDGLVAFARHNPE
jgi:hypothetical protein